MAKTDTEAGSAVPPNKKNNSANSAGNGQGNGVATGGEPVEPPVRHSPEQIETLFRTGKYPYPTKISRPEYQAHKEELQVELLKVQNWVKQTGQRIVVLCEGRDAAGKGGTIKRFHGAPESSCRSVWLRLKSPPNMNEESGTFKRYIKHLPSEGRNGVLRPLLVQPRRCGARNGTSVTSTEYLEFMRQVPDLERMLVRSGIRLFKYWFSVTHEEQARRFDSRQQDPLKQWKLSPIDELSRDKWNDYTEAKEAMFFYTDTADAPWTVIKSDDKKARAAQLHAAFPVESGLSWQECRGRARAGPADRRRAVPGNRAKDRTPLVRLMRVAPNPCPQAFVSARRRTHNRRRSASASPRRSAVNPARPGREQR